MREFFRVWYRPNRETGCAAGLGAAYIVVLAVMLGLVAPRFEAVAGAGVTLFYVVMLGVVLGFARRQGFAAVGLVRRRWLVAAISGGLIGALGLMSTVSLFPGGSFTMPGWPRLVALLAAGLSGGLIEALVLYGYLQFRLEEALGPVVAVLGSALAWTLAHGAVVSTPGAGTFAAQRVGVSGFLASLFVTFLVLGLIVHFTRNIWAAVVQNAVMGNVLTNLYMLSVMPDEVFIASASNLPVAVLIALYVTAGLVWARRPAGARGAARARSA